MNYKINSFVLYKIFFVDFCCVKIKYIIPEIEILEEIHSTNDHLMSLLKNEKCEEGKVIMTLNQTDGKGQRGNTWHSEPNKNLQFSILLKPEIPVQKTFYLNIISSLAVHKTLTDLKISAKIKWPNDILVNQYKISGILVENSIQKNVIHQSVIGIGLNVNQTHFPAKIKASSILLEISKEIELLDILKQIISYLDFYYDFLKQSNYAFLLKKYYENLFGYQEIKKYKSNEIEFEGEIIGITDEGKLKIKPKTGLIQTFDIKEVEFLF